MNDKGKLLAEWEAIFDSEAWRRERFWKELTLKKMQEFIEAGVDVNAKDSDGDTPFHYAVANIDNAQVIKELIHARADIHAKGLDGATPLHDAAGYNRSVGVTKELIKAGADVNAKDNDGKTPALLCCI